LDRDEASSAPQVEKVVERRHGSAERKVKKKDRRRREEISPDVEILPTVSKEDVIRK